MTTTTHTPARPATRLSSPAVLHLALAAALGTAAIYPLQPAIADVATSLDSSTAAVGLALSCGPVGYLVGLALLVPLVDCLRPRFVVAIQLGALAAALAAMSLARDPVSLGLLMLVTGACSSVGAGLSSIAGRFAPPARRATVLGVVTAGISAGILAGRMVGGWLADAVGWHAMLLVMAAACGTLAVTTGLLLPGAAGRAAYLRTIASIPGLHLRFGALRLAALRGAAWFFAFCTVWSGLAVELAGPPHHFSSEKIGLFALAGLLGIVATRVAGRLTDRVGAQRVILAGLAVAGTTVLVLGVAIDSTLVALVCLALFDAGLFAAQVANQSTVLTIDPETPARFNSAYMIVYFVGGSLGTAFGAAAIGWVGWSGTTLVAVGAVLGAALLTLRRGWVQAYS